MFLTIVLLSCVISLVGYIWYMSSSHGLFKKMGLPGPTPWPVLGNMMQEFGGEGTFDYHVKMFLKHKKDKVYGLFRARMPTLVICDLDMIREICVKQFHNFQNRLIYNLDPPFSNMMVELEDDHWKRVRSTVSPSFNTVKLRKMQPHIERNTRLLLDHLKDKQERNEPVELRDLLSAYTMDVIASTGFGIENNTLKDGDNAFSKAAQSLINSNGRFLIIAFFFNFLRPFLKLIGVTVISKETNDAFTGFIDRAIECRKTEGSHASGRSDFIQLMLDAETDADAASGTKVDDDSEKRDQASNSKKVLSYADIQGQAAIFLLAGFDTVATVLSFTLFLVAMHPECLEKAQEEVDSELGDKFPDYDSVQSLPYLEMCINEAMRLYPPGFLLDRQVNNDTEVEGVKLPKGLNVTVPVCAIHRDPEQWPEPEKFDPERFTTENKATRHPYAFLPFGQGPRNCIGMRLALLEMKVALTAILQTLTPVRCEKTVLPIKQDPFQAKAKDGLWVKFETR